MVPAPFLLAFIPLANTIKVLHLFLMRGSRGQIVNLSAVSGARLRRQLACVRRTTNHFLAESIARYQRDGTFLFFHEMSAECTKLRAGDPFLREAPRGTQTHALQALERALKDSFPSARNRKGFPRFRSASHQRDSMTIQAKEVGIVRQDGIVTYIRWPKVGLLRVRGMRLPASARVGFVTIRQTAHGYQASLCHELAEPAAVVPAQEPVVGMDLGLTSLVALSTGEKIAPPRFARKAARRLARAQRVMSRRKKGSSNRRRARMRVARLHARVARLRENHLHHLSRMLVDRFEAIGVEDLNVQGLARTRLARGVYDAGWGELLRQIAYKSAWAGRKLYEHPRFARSTGICPDCSWAGPRLRPGIQAWTCGGCGVRHDRDIAAARVIARAAGMVGAACPEPVSALSAPKRASAGERKRRSSDRRAAAGPATNVPDADVSLQTA